MKRYYITIVCNDQRHFYAVTGNLKDSVITFVADIEQAYGFIYWHYCDHQRDLLWYALKPSLADTLIIVERTLSA